MIQLYTLLSNVLSFKTTILHQFFLDFLEVGCFSIYIENISCALLFPVETLGSQPLKLSTHQAKLKLSEK